MAVPAGYRRLYDAVVERRPKVALILGSGLGDLDERLCDVVSIPFFELPGMTGTGVPGHKGNAVLGLWAGVPVLVYSGRLHYYEGHAWRRVMQPIHVAREFGITTLILTNAAGGIRADLTPGTLLALTNHMEWTAPWWWRAPGPGGLAGTRPSPYDPDLRRQLQAAAEALGVDVSSGIYAQVTGPCYETKAEIRALRHCGADAVGMSTAHEVRVAHAMGMRCAALSCITNRAAGLSPGPIHHGEVIDVAGRLRDRLASLLETYLVASWPSIG